MNIIICDDDELWLEHARDIIRIYGRQCKKEFNIKLCKNQKELLEKCMDEPDVVFMDIELKEENGIDLASSINQ